MPFFDFPVLHCNIHQNFKWPVLWFPKGIGWNFLDIWNQWTKTNQEMQRAFAKKDFWIFPLKPEPPYPTEQVEEEGGDPTEVKEEGGDPTEEVEEEGGDSTEESRGASWDGVWRV